MSEAIPQLARGSRRRRVHLFLTLGILLLLIGYAGLDLWAGHRVNVEVARLEKRYGYLREDTMRAAGAPAADNRARVVRAAAALISTARFAVWRSTSLPPSTPNSPPAHYEDLQSVYNRLLYAPESAPVPTELRAFVEANRAALRVADDVRTRHESNWEVDYWSGGQSPPWADITTLSSAIYVDALLDLEGGRPDEAARASATGLAVSASLRQESDLLAQLIRVSIGLQHFDAVHRLIVRADPSKASLAELARWLAEDRPMDPSLVALLSELKRRHAALTRAENGKGHDSALMADQVPIHVSTYAATFEPPFWLAPLARLDRPFIRLTHARYLRQVGALLDSAAGPRPRPALGSTDQATSTAGTKEDEALAGLARSMETFDLFTTELGATEVAVALRRFKIDHGTYPKDLSALTPVYVANLPIDAFTGEPPVYTRQGAGFHLHVQGGPHVPRVGPRVMVSALDWIVPK